LLKLMVIAVRVVINTTKSFQGLGWFSSSYYAYSKGTYTGAVGNRYISYCQVVASSSKTHY
jgi:hypothetical protein